MASIKKIQNYKFIYISPSSNDLVPFDASVDNAIL